MNIGEISFKDNLSEAYKQKEKELNEYKNKIPAQEQIISELKSLIDEDSVYSDDSPSSSPSPIKAVYKTSKQEDILNKDVQQELLRYKIENSKLKQENQSLKTQIQLLSQSNVNDTVSSTSAIRDHYSKEIKEYKRKIEYFKKLLDTFKIEYDENDIETDEDNSSTDLSSYPPIPKIILPSNNNNNNNKPSMILPISQPIPSSFQPERQRFNYQHQKQQHIQPQPSESDLVKSPNMVRYSSMNYEHSKPFYQNSYTNNYFPVNSENINSVFDGLDDKINQLRGYL